MLKTRFFLLSGRLLNGHQLTVFRDYRGLRLEYDIISILLRMLYGRKPCDIEDMRSKYIQHLKRLQQVKNGRDKHHRTIQKQQRNMSELLKVSHHLHNISLKEQFKRREDIELQTHKRSYDNIRSIIKGEFNKKTMPVPNKHKPNHYFRDLANLKLIDRIVNVKSQFNFREQSIQRIAANTARIRYQCKNDFTDLYQKSMIFKERTNKIYIKIGKAKVNNKIVFKILSKESLNCLKQDSDFMLQVECGNKTKMSKSYLLQELTSSTFHISFADNDLTIYFLERVGEKHIKRFKICFSEQEILSSQKLWTSKPILDMKNRAVGLIELELNKLKKNVQKKMFYDHITSDQNGPITPLEHN